MVISARYNSLADCCTWWLNSPILVATDRRCAGAAPSPSRERAMNDDADCRDKPEPPPVPRAAQYGVQKYWTAPLHEVGKVEVGPIEPGPHGTSELFTWLPKFHVLPMFGA